jgi:hypothetical protein
VKLEVLPFLINGEHARVQILVCFHGFVRTCAVLLKEDEKRVFQGDEKQVFADEMRNGLLVLAE